MSVVASLYGESTAELVGALEDLARRRSMVELRLDRIGPKVDLVSLARAAGELRVLLACVPRDQGGEFDGDQVAWQECILTATRLFPRTAYVDIPPQFERPDQLPQSVSAVWSWHAERKQSKPEDCMAALHRAKQRAAAGDVIKLVTWAQTHQESLRVLELYRDWPKESPRLLAFAQGPGSRASRVFALSLGAPWLYCAYQGKESAPGQWSEAELPIARDWQSTRWFGVLGQPVEHSRSPLLWNCAFRWHAKLSAHGHDDNGAPSHYLALEHADLQQFREAYQPACFAAFSVTSPLKELALAAADTLAPSARRIGAANWLKRDANGDWVAASTDGEGAMRALEAAGLDSGAPVWVLGAGGAARAVWLAAIERGHPLIVVARRPQRAVQALGELSLEAKVVDWHRATLPEDQSFALVNATPVGFGAANDDPCANWPIPACAKVLDMVYQPVETALLKRARLAGAAAIPGHHMLLEQMRLQFADIYGVEPPRQLLCMALEADLGLAQPSLVLVGPRASGKSTLGRMLAEALAWDFIDADTELERRTGRSIGTWVAEDLPGFRQAESDLLTELLQRPNAVIALGGGVVETAPACAALAAHPRVLALKLSSNEQLARRQNDQRPALTQSPLAEEIEFLQQKRASLYEKASSGRCVNVEGLTSDAFRRLVESLNLYW